MPRVMLLRPERKITSYVKKQVRGLNPRPPSPSPLGEEGGGGNAREKEEGKKMSLDDLLVLAEQLEPTERKKLLASLALREQKTTETGQSRDLDMWAGAVQEQLAIALGGGDRGEVGVFVVRRALASTSSWGAVTRFMKASKLDALKVTERQGVYLLLAKLTLQHTKHIAQTSGAPLSARLVSSVATNMAGIFDQAFPGYLASGLAHLVAKQLVTPR